MLQKLIEAHKLMCQRKHVSYEYTPVSIVPESFYDEKGVFNQELFDKVIEGMPMDKSQSFEERAAVGQRYSVHVNRLKQLCQN